MPQVASASAGPSTAPADDCLKSTKARLLALFLETPEPAHNQAPQHSWTRPWALAMADAQDPNGSRPDLDYGAPSKNSGPLPSFPHLRRLLGMAKAYRTAVSPQYQG